MSIQVKNAKSITLGGQEVKQITDTNGNVLWSKVQIKWYEREDWYNYTNEAVADEIGVECPIIVNNIEHKVRLIGIDHDDLAGGSGKVHTTWQFTNLLSDSNGYSLSALWQDTGEGRLTANYDFPNSTLRKCLDGLGNGTLAWYTKGGATKSTTYIKPVIEMLPSGLQNVLKNVSKPIGVYQSGSYFVVSSYNTKVFLLSHYEITYDSGSFEYALPEGTQYAYWQTHDTVTDRIMRQLKGSEGALTTYTSITDPLWGSGSSYAGYNNPTAGNGGIQWLRSPYTSGGIYSWMVYVTGDLYSYGAYDTACAVAPCFCI